jgi:hypothetical protein
MNGQQMPPEKVAQCMLLLSLVCGPVNVIRTVAFHPQHWHPRRQCT